jgi:hypothetical protein
VGRERSKRAIETAAAGDMIVTDTERWVTDE